MKNRINRRHFLKKAAGAAAGVLAFPYFIPSSALGKAGTVAPSNRIVMGCIGYGWQGGTNTKNLLQRKEVQYVAVCDVDKNHLAEAKLEVDNTYGNKDCAVYTDFRELIGRGDLDAVNIALPDRWHAIPAIEAARAGLDIHGEKPLTHNLAEGRQLSDAVKHYGLIWQTGSWQRSVENFHRACELVRNGRIGKIVRVEVGLGAGFTDYGKTKGQETPGPAPEELDYDRWLGPAPWAPYCPARVHKNWRWHLDYGGGTIMDWVGHHVDIAHWGMDCDNTGPVEIHGTGKAPLTGLWNAHTEYNVNCRYANGVVMNISDSNAGGTKWIGEEGWVYVNRGGLDAYPKSILQETIGPNEIHLYKSVDHMQNFLDCVKTRKLPITPCETAHRSASVGHLALIAIMTGRKIKWDPEKELIIADADASKLLRQPMRSPWHL